MSNYQINDDNNQITLNNLTNNFKKGNKTKELEETDDIKKSLYYLIWKDNKKDIIILIICYLFTSFINASNGIMIYFVNKGLSLETEEEVLYYGKILCGFYLLYGIVYTSMQTFQM